MKILKIFIILIPIYSFSQATWQATPNIYINSGFSRFDDVCFLNENLGWAANGSSAAVYKTTDGGLTWVEQLNESDLDGNYYFRNIEFLNEQIGFLGTLNGAFFKTVDGGNNWLLVNNISPNPQAICGLDTIGNSTIYGCGAYFTPAYIIKSIDSGISWEYIDMSSHANALVEVYFLDENNGYAAGRSDSGGVILKTTDGGQNWIEIFNSNIPGEYVWKIQILENSTNTIFGSVYSVSPNPGKLIKSFDSGQNWISLNAPESEVQAVGFITTERGWMGGHNTGFYETNDGGQTWINTQVGANLNKILILNNNKAYAAGQTIYKFTEETLGSLSFNDNSKNNFQIKISPNPFNTKLEITINFKNPDNILIELYDIKGSFIKQLHRDIIKESKSKSYDFDLNNLQSGAYILDFHTNNSRVQKKIIKQ